jgi:hypothetical protein
MSWSPTLRATAHARGAFDLCISDPLVSLAFFKGKDIDQPLEFHFFPCSVQHNAVEVDRFYRSMPERFLQRSAVTPLLFNEVLLVFIFCKPILQALALCPKLPH